jgi:hypothetical protein
LLGALRDDLTRVEPLAVLNPEPKKPDADNPKDACDRELCNGVGEDRFKKKDSIIADLFTTHFMNEFTCDCGKAKPRYTMDAATGWDQFCTNENEHELEFYIRSKLQKQDADDRKECYECGKKMFVTTTVYTAP